MFYLPPNGAGEHIFPWYYEEDPALRPLAEVAQLLAEKKDWGLLYDHEQLHRNEVPVVAAAYTPDIYVDYEKWRQPGGWVTPMCGRRRLITMMVLALTR